MRSRASSAIPLIVNTTPAASTLPHSVFFAIPKRNIGLMSRSGVLLKQLLVSQNLLYVRADKGDERKYDDHNCLP